MVTAAFVSVVDFCRRRALLIALLGVALGILSGVYAATHIAFDTNTGYPNRSGQNGCLSGL